MMIRVRKPPTIIRDERIEGSVNWGISAKRLLERWLGRGPELFGTDQAGAPMKSDVYG
jgi:hypothetical protein